MGRVGVVGVRGGESLGVSGDWIVIDFICFIRRLDFILLAIGREIGV